MNEKAYDREIEHLERQLEDGDLTLAEFNKQMAELDREAREELRQEARRAYDEVMGDGWWDSL